MHIDYGNFLSEIYSKLGYNYTCDKGNNFSNNGLLFKNTKRRSERTIILRR